jgi:hypothetical protein
MEPFNTLDARVGLDSLADVQTFLSAAQHLKSLTLELRHLQARRSRREHSIALQIECITRLLDEQAAETPRLREFWSQARAELSALTDPPPLPCTPPATPCKGGTT